MCFKWHDQTGALLFRREPFVGPEAGRDEWHHGTIGGLRRRESPPAFRFAKDPNEARGKQSVALGRFPIPDKACYNSLELLAS
jgi:hypothetical protein